jgi:hypothetical protein
MEVRKSGVVVFAGILFEGLGLGLGLRVRVRFKG